VGVISTPFGEDLRSSGHCLTNGVIDIEKIDWTILTTNAVISKKMAIITANIILPLVGLKKSHIPLKNLILPWCYIE
jgi:hypothetical protein